MFSIGLSSGLWGGQFITSMFSSSRNDFFLDVWHGGLSCMKTEGCKYEKRMWAMAYYSRICLYYSALTVPWIRIRGPQLASDIIPQTITLPPPNSTFFFTRATDNLYPFLRRTHVFPSDPITLYFDSPVKSTCDHFSSVQTTCSLANLKQAFWFFLEISFFRWPSQMQSHDIQPTRTVWCDTLQSDIESSSRDILAAVLNLSRDIIAKILACWV